MLYASIALVAAGIALIVYSFIVRERSGSVRVPESDMPQSDYSRRDEEAPMQSAPRSDAGDAQTAQEIDTASAGKQEVAVPPRKAVSEPGDTAEDVGAEEKKDVSKDELVPVKTAPKPVEETRAPAKAVADEPNSAVLYHDASGVVDYESRENVIDPSFKKYARLKRIGRGAVSVVKDGINFQLRKKLYRFEFYRIEKMLQGKNYVAIFLKGSDEARLMIFDRDSGLDRRLIGEFRAFKKRSQ